MGSTYPSYWALWKSEIIPACEVGGVLLALVLLIFTGWWLTRLVKQRLHARRVETTRSPTLGKY